LHYHADCLGSITCVSKIS